MYLKYSQIFLLHYPNQLGQCILHLPDTDVNIRKLLNFEAPEQYFFPLRKQESTTCSPIFSMIMTEK